MKQNNNKLHGIDREYKEEPIEICERLNKNVKDSNYFCVIHSEDDGYYIVRLNWAIENEFLYSIYW